MCVLLVTALLVSVSIEIARGEVNSHDCPPWTIFNSTSNECECGSDVDGAVQCNSENKDISVKKCYCMSYSDKMNKSFLSYCFYSCYWSKEYYPVTTKNVSDLNNFTCGRFFRTGLMCGECIAGYAPPVYSYDLACVPCQNYKYNWLKYIAVAYLPLTVFYIFIVVLRISVSSAPMVVYVTVSQIIAAPGLLRLYSSTHVHSVLVDAITSSYAIWNLDFFRGLYPLCLHPDLSTLQVICLDYLIGVYPLVLIFITYRLVCLHDRYVVISKLWRPIFKSCSLLRREWNIRESLVKAFATFLILSYVKIMNASFDILSSGHSYNDVDGNRCSTPYLSINGSLPYFSKEHVPYAICAILMLLIFNVFPLLLLCLYPSSCFQKCLNLTRCRCQILHVFMDIFQGCYREKPWDCRYFAGFYIFLRSINLMAYAFTQDPLYFSLAIFAIVFTLMLVSIAKPYKNGNRNTIDVVLFALTIFIYTATCTVLEYPFVVPTRARHQCNTFGAIFIIIACLLPLYGFSLMLYQVGNFALRVIVPHHLKIISFFKRRKVLESSFSSLLDHVDEHSQLIN